MRSPFTTSFVALAAVASTLTVFAQPSGAPDATALVREAFHHYRGQASHGQMTMTIHRPEWERSQSLEAWTRGEEDSVIIMTAPPRDRGNATLKRGHQMWTFNPRINRVIKLPPSLMGQSWMGSDFTNHDLARSDSIVIDYNHSLLGTEERDGHTVYHLKLTPKDGAPVVWGHEELLIRDDKILLEERYFDQDGQLVKTLVASEIRKFGERILPAVLNMVQAEDAERYTRVVYESLEFRPTIPDRYFTEAFLRNPRE